MALGSKLSAYWCMAVNGMGNYHILSKELQVLMESYMKQRTVDGAGRWAKIKHITLPE